METDRADFIYLSPHLDDAILSCAGQISRHAREQKTVLVYTPMAAEDLPDPVKPNGARFLKLCGLGPDAGRVRRGEDRRACERAGARPLFGDLLEALYRCGPDGKELYPTHDSLFGSVRPEDGALAALLAEKLAGLPPSDAVMAPLGAGGHVDHQLVRRAAEQVFGAKLAYYEDYPYAGKWGAVSRLTRPRRDWHGSVVCLDAEARRAREEAIMEYGSQWPMIFGSQDDFRRKNRWFLWRRGGERIWRRRA